MFKFEFDGAPSEIGLRFKSASQKQIRAIGEKPEGYIAGWASTPALDDYGTVFETGAFSDAIRRRGIRGPSGVKFLIGHDTDRPAGRIEVLEYRGNSLWLEAQMELEIGYVRDFWLAAKINEGFNFSIRFDKPEWRVTQDVTGDEYISITKADLLEVSAVTIPANEECVMTDIRSMNEGSPTTLAEFDRMLIREGIARTRDDARRITQAVKNSSKLFRMVGRTEPDSGADHKTERDRLPSETFEELARKIAEARTEIGSGSR